MASPATTAVRSIACPMRTCIESKSRYSPLRATTDQPHARRAGSSRRPSRR
jgi:hypothetical protein